MCLCVAVDIIETGSQSVLFLTLPHQVALHFNRLCWTELSRRHVLENGLAQRMFTFYTSIIFVFVFLFQCQRGLTSSLDFLCPLVQKT